MSGEHPTTSKNMPLQVGVGLTFVHLYNGLMLHSFKIRFYRAIKPSLKYWGLYNNMLAALCQNQTKLVYDGFIE